MSTATDTRTLYCTEPVLWPDPEALISRPTKSNTCWKGFSTEAERQAHIETDHAEWWAEIQGIREGTAALPNPVGHSTVLEGGGRGPSGPPQGKSDNGPSEKQLAFIASLAADKGVEVPECKTRKAASDAIERLQAMPTTNPIRRNRYDGRCHQCNSHVPAGEGGIVKDAATGRWLTHCTACPEGGVVQRPEIPDGRYAVTGEAGHTIFYKVTAGRNPGVIFVDLLVGGGANGSLSPQKVPSSQVDTALAKIAEAGPKEAAIRFGREVGICSCCGRGLTNPASIEAGIGPKCAKDAGWD